MAHEVFWSLERGTMWMRSVVAYVTDEAALGGHGDRPRSRTVVLLNGAVYYHDEIMTDGIEEKLPPMI